MIDVLVVPSVSFVEPFDVSVTTTVEAIDLAGVGVWHADVILTVVNVVDVDVVAAVEVVVDAVAAEGVVDAVVAVEVVVVDDVDVVVAAAVVFVDNNYTVPVWTKE